jgi:hypothetical protein
LRFCATLLRLPATALLRLPATALLRLPATAIVRLPATVLLRLPATAIVILQVGALAFALATLTIIVSRSRARARRRYTRLTVLPYRGDEATAQAIVNAFEALHKRLLRRWWRRLLSGQPSVGLEIHYHREAWLALTCPVGSEPLIEAALRTAYPNCRLEPTPRTPGAPPYVIRLKKRHAFIERAKPVDRFEHDRAPAVNRLITTIAACATPAFVQFSLTPTPAFFEGYAKCVYQRRERRLSRRRKLHIPPLDRSLLDDAELRGGLAVQHRPLFFADLRVIGPTRQVCERIASELRAVGAENHLVERGTTLRHGWLGLYTRRVLRGEGPPLPPWRRGVFASTEMASLWHAPSIDYATVPLRRHPLPLAPAPPAILRVGKHAGCLRDAHGPVSIHPHLRRQNTAVCGTVEQGKSSYLVATILEDLARPRCAVIVLDPKGDAAEAAVGLVPPHRTCTLLDFAHPTCGFNPLAVDAPADTIADYVVSALKHLFSDGDIKASSDRYLRNAIIAVLAHDRASSLWDAARLLSVGEDGYAYRARVAQRLRTQPEFKEICEFFTGELAAQLADARGTTTAKLDAPVNKLARLLNSSSIKRVLLNDSLSIDFDRVIEDEEVLVVKGALGTMGAGNTTVLMQLLVGMLDASLARRQDQAADAPRIAVALKVDEAPLVLNRGFTETMALKRSAGLETVACWQTDSQWTDRDVRAQLDALFAHRVYFATASVEDARNAVKLMMAEFSDSVRPGIRNLSALGRPDVRLRLPRHTAIASWVTPEGRQAPFIAHTLPLSVNHERLALHASRQTERGGRYREDLSQRHWAREHPSKPAPRSHERPGRHPPEPTTPPHRSAPARSSPATHPTPSDSYRELVDLSAAVRVRQLPPPNAPLALDPEPLDLEILAFLASMRHLLSSQIHRRFNERRALTTTQRRLKRLSDAGLVTRYQFHHRDGGGMPMCYALAPAGSTLLAKHRPPPAIAASSAHAHPHNDPTPSKDPRGGDRLLRQAHHDIRAAGWALAFERALGRGPLEMLGPDESPISPPPSPRSANRSPLTLSDLSLPDGRTPHDFLRTTAPSVRVEVERFQTVRPDVTIRRPGHRDLLVELDDRLPDGPGAPKLERYDHFLTGWSAHLPRYAAELPLVAFVCRDRPRARECARRADRILTACRAYAGEYPSTWDHTGRTHIVFLAERDAHEGSLTAFLPPPLPPHVRLDLTEGDPRAREPLIESRELDIH